MEGRQLLTVAIAEAQIPLPGSPGGSSTPSIIAGPDGNVWFIGATNTIGRITPDGTITEFNVGGLRGLKSLTIGPDGNLWFIKGPTTTFETLMAAGSTPAPADDGPAQHFSSVCRITPDGVVTELPLPDDLFAANSLVAGPDGNLWVAARDTIVRVTTSGEVTRFRLSDPFSSVSGLTRGPDGTLWFTKIGGKLGRMTTSGAITEMALPGVGVSSGTRLGGLTTGPDGNLWVAVISEFAPDGHNELRRITPDGVTTATLTLPADAIGTIAGPDGNFWIVGRTGVITRLALDGTTTSFTSPTPGLLPGVMTVGPDGNLWYLSAGGYRIGQVVLDAPPDAPTIATGIASTVDEARPFKGPLVTFTDADPGLTAGNFVVQIDWGDGGPGPDWGKVEPDGHGGFVVSGLHDHSYYKQGTYTVHVTITDVQIGHPGSPVVATATITVAGAPLATESTDTLAFRDQAGPVVVARARAVDATGSYTATIDWGDGTTSAGTVGIDYRLPWTTDRPGWSTPIAGPSMLAFLNVSGNHVYDADGWYVVTTRIVDEAGLEAVVTSQVQYRTPAIFDAHGLNWSVNVGSPAGNAAVGAFSTNGAGLPAGLFSATVDWGDGSAPTAGVLSQVGPHNFVVHASHTYEKAGRYVFHVTVAGLGDPVVITGTARVVTPVTARLDPASDTGPSHADGITSATRPRLEGQAAPGALVKLYARRNGARSLLSIGQARAGADGHWSVVSTRLAEGSYAITAHATAPDGSKTSGPVRIGGSTRPLVVDTTGPQVMGATLDPRTSQLRASFSDSLTGLDPRGLADPARYALVRVTAAGASPIAIRPVSVAPNGRSVTLGLPRPLPPGRYALRIASGAVRDAAGNPLDGEFRGQFATGDRRPGGNFTALFDVSRTQASAARPV